MAQLVNRGPSAVSNSKGTTETGPSCPTTVKNMKFFTGLRSQNVRPQGTVSLLLTVLLVLLSLF